MQRFDVTRVIVLFEDCYAMGIICWWWARHELERRLRTMLGERVKASSLTEVTPARDRVVSL